MTKLIKATALALALLSAAPAAADTLTYKSEGLSLEMKKGSFSSDNYKVWQMITVTNNSSVKIDYATVECGFFHDDLLIAEDSEMISHLEAGQSAYVKVYARILAANRTDCRFGTVSR
jgi:hypothetical protein